MGRVLGGGGGGFSSSCGGDSLRLGGPLGGSPCIGDHLGGGPAPLLTGDRLVSWVAGPAPLFGAGGAGHEM